MEKQKTIAKEVSFSGITLHTGIKSQIIFKPASVNTGIKFIRTDLPGKPEIPARFEYVLGVTRGTTLSKDGVEINTTEHLLSSFYGMGIDNLYIELSASEPPVGDGSALPYVTMIDQAGIIEQDAEKHTLPIYLPTYYQKDNTYIVAYPSTELIISCTIDYQHPQLRNQYASFILTPETFKREIAPARTFCFDYEIESLKKRGLGKGGSLENAIVIGLDKIHTAENELRFADEFVRHKILDLLGDLYLLGRPLKAHIIAIRCGHNHNIALTREIAKQDDYQITLPPLPDTERWLTREEITKIIPHRPPFLFVDRVKASPDGMHATGYKLLTGQEDFFRGHFPGHPIMPGVLIIETMAQTSCILFLSRPEVVGKLAYFMGISEAKFRRPLFPGDLLEVKIEVLRARERTGKVRGEVYTSGQLAVEAEFMFSLVDLQENKNEK